MRRGLWALLVAASLAGRLLLGPREAQAQAGPLYSPTTVAGVCALSGVILRSAGLSWDDCMAGWGWESAGPGEWRSVAAPDWQVGGPDWLAAYGPGGSCYRTAAVWGQECARVPGDDEWEPLPLSLTAGVVRMLQALGRDPAFDFSPQVQALMRRAAEFDTAAGR